MRELHGWHERGDHGRHARDAHAPADGRAARVHDGPRHAADSSLKLRMLLDPEARKAARLDYQKKVEAAEAEYAARHARPKPSDRGGDQRRGTEQLRPQETAAERKDAQSEAKAALAEVDNRTLPKSTQVPDVAARQKNRVSDKDISYIAMVGSYIVKTAAEYVSVIPPHLAGDISGGLLVLAAGLVLRRERHRKDGNADRSKD
jgi:hypothetical protein